MRILVLILFMFAVTECKPQSEELKMKSNNNPYYSRTDTTHLDVSDTEWKKILPAEVYRVAREAGTEYPFSGEYWDSEAKELIIVLFAEISFSAPQPSLPAHVDGQVFLKLKDLMQ
jgi:hypothetical protein